MAPDEADNRFLECALEARAAFLVRGNLRHFRWQRLRTSTSRARTVRPRAGRKATPMTPTLPPLRAAAARPFRPQFQTLAEVPPGSNGLPTSPMPIRGGLPAGHRGLHGLRRPAAAGAVPRHHTRPCDCLARAARRAGACQRYHPAQARGPIVALCLSLRPQRRTA